MNSEMLTTFDESREVFKPYGLTCELWSPSLMSKPDRHNEIELNFSPKGTITYLFQDSKITIPKNRLATFWGLIPHQIVHFEGNSPYYVCTIPFSLFFEWNLPASFIDRVLNGDVMLEGSEVSSSYDEFLLENWFRDLNNNDVIDVVLQEMQARLSRLAINNLSTKRDKKYHIQSNEISYVERIAIYIAQNYFNPIDVSEIGKAVGLHPDYANTLFKRAFGCTLNEFINEERIAYAQRKLMTTDAKITTIAYECGFNSISWFNATFKKINDCTPRDFRKMNSPKL